MENNSMLKETELTSEVNLCDNNGKLLKSSIGWARKPIFNCNLKGHNLRKKRWNYWYMINDSILFSVTISSLDYVGMVFAYAYDFKSGIFAEKTIAAPFGKGCNLSQNVCGDASFSNNSIQVYFKDVDGDTHINMSAKEFNGHPLSADLIVHMPENHETLNVVIPWNDNVFQFTSKQNCLPVEGTVIAFGKTYTFNPETDFAGLDFGRGIWPYKIMWNWGTGSGIQEGHHIGFNLGGTWTDGTGMTENAIIIDGHITKLSENVDYIYDKDNLMAPWQIKTHNTNRVNLKFTPTYDRLAKTDALVLSSCVHQMIGSFSGTIMSDDGLEVHIESLAGCAEEHYAKW